MLAKVAFLCAVMAAVQSRAELYRTLIMDTITSNPSDKIVKVDSIEVLRQRIGDGSENKIEYTFYDLGSKILQTISNKARQTSSLPGAPRIISSNAEIPEATFNSVIYEVEPGTEGQSSFKGSFLGENESDLLFSTGNESFADSELSKISGWGLASELIEHGMPGLVALGYED